MFSNNVVALPSEAPYSQYKNKISCSVFPGKLFQTSEAGASSSEAPYT